VRPGRQGRLPLLRAPPFVVAFSCCFACRAMPPCLLWWPPHGAMLEVVQVRVPRAGGAGRRRYSRRGRERAAGWGIARSAEPLGGRGEAELPEGAMQEAGEAPLPPLTFHSRRSRRRRRGAGRQAGEGSFLPTTIPSHLPCSVRSPHVCLPTRPQHASTARQEMAWQVKAEKERAEKMLKEADAEAGAQCVRRSSECTGRRACLASHPPVRAFRLFISPMSAGYPVHPSVSRAGLR